MSACANAGRTKQQVVLKILKCEGSGDSDLLSRFVQEYFAASSIDSPYVAKVFEHGFTDSHAYIVMEYFPAGDLRARMARDRPVGRGIAHHRRLDPVGADLGARRPASSIAISSPRT